MLVTAPDNLDVAMFALAFTSSFTIARLDIDATLLESIVTSPVIVVILLSTYVYVAFCEGTSVSEVPKLVVVLIFAPI